MATKQSRAEKEAQDKAERETALAEVKQVYELERQRILPKYNAPLIQTPRSADALASHLSEQYKTLQVSVVYQNGAKTVTVTPLVFPNSSASHEMHYKAANEIRTLVTSKRVEEYWPSFAEVQAYARGYDVACASAQELKELKEENRRLKEAGMGMMHHPFFARHLF